MTTSVKHGLKKLNLSQLRPRGIGPIPHYVPTRGYHQSSQTQPFHVVQEPNTHADEHGIPLRPVWSVRKLLASYPHPSISPNTFERIHRLSALIPPKEGSPERENVTKELEGLIGMVEAVRLPALAKDSTSLDEDNNTQLQLEDSGIPDGRIWMEDSGIDLSESNTTKELEPRHCGGNSSGSTLLEHAARTSNGLYVIDQDKRRN